MSDRQDRWLHVLIAMAAVQFMVGLAFSIVPPVLPLYLAHLGVDSPGGVRRWAGLVVGITPLAAALTAPFWGRAMTRIDGRAIVLLSCVSAAGCTAAMSLATSASQLLALRFFMGLFGGHIAACMAIISARTPPSRLGLALGTLVTMQLAGSLLGPLVCGLVADTTHDLRAPFLAGGLGALLVCPALLAVPKRRSEERPPELLGSGAAQIRGLSPWLPAIVMILVQAAIMGPQPIVSLQVAHLLGDPNPSVTLAGFAFSVVGLSGLLAAPLLGALGDRLGRGRLLLLCLACGAALTAAQAAAASYQAFVAARFLAGLCLTGVIPMVNAAAVRGMSASLHGRLFGVTSGAAFLGAFLGSVTAGQISAVLGLPSVFIASSAYLVIAACTLSRWPALHIKDESGAARQ